MGKTLRFRKGSGVTHSKKCAREGTCGYPEQQGGGVVRPHQAVDGLEEPLQ